MAITLGIVQFDRSSGKPEVNHRKMVDLLEGISSPATDFILLPEDWLGPLIVKHEYYISVLNDLKNCLSSGNTLLAAGSQYVQYPDKTISMGAFINKREMIYYDKHFPSRAIGERNFITPGNRLPVVEHNGIKAGAVVCVDLFYPETVRRLAMKGAALIFNPASIPASRAELWQHIGITRAAENTVFLAMANNTNTCYPDRRKVMGRSFVAGPDGIFFKDFGSEPGVYFTEINPDIIVRTRKRWGYLEDIKLFNK